MALCPKYQCIPPRERTGTTEGQRGGPAQDSRPTHVISQSREQGGGMASTDGAAAPAAPAAPAAAVEDDDPVIRELDVYLSTQLANELYILQFPLRPAARPYDRTNDNAPLAARFKPKVRPPPGGTGATAGWRRRGGSREPWTAVPTGRGRVGAPGPAPRARGPAQYGDQLRPGRRPRVRPVLPVHQRGGGRPAAGRRHAHAAADLDGGAQQDALRPGRRQRR